MNSVWIVNSRYMHMNNNILSVEHVASSREKAIEFTKSPSGKEVMDNENNEFIHWMIYEADIDNDLLVKNSFNIFGTKDGKFMDLLMKNEIYSGSINEYIEKWHTSGAIENQSIAEYLGMTNKEHEYYIKNANYTYAVEDIVEARKQNSPLV